MRMEKGTRDLIWATNLLPMCCKTTFFRTSNFWSEIRPKKKNLSFIILIEYNKSTLQINRRRDSRDTTFDAISRPIYVLVDRHSIHTSKPIQAWQKRTEAPVGMHLWPAYSPEWNPTEQVRSVVQRRVGKLLVRMVRQLRERWEQALPALETDPATVPGFFREADCT